jgi:RNA polymerase sigma-70 factor (ECF subfamily)
MAGSNSAARAPASLDQQPLDSRRSATPLPSFEAIYKLYLDFVWSSVRRLGVGDDAVDDVVQEVFVIIHARLHTLQQPDSLRSWIYGVVRRTVSGYRRSLKARGRSSESVGFFDQAALESGQLTPSEQKEQNDRLNLLAKLLSELDESKREVFWLAELDEMTVPEIAHALEIPLNTAYSRLRAARQAFEQALTRHTARERGGRLA